METRTFRVPTIISGEDLERVTAALRQTPGVRDVDVDAGIKEFKVRFGDPATWDDLERNLEALGYVPDIAHNDSAETDRQ